jgi:hypothetical protein
VRYAPELALLRERAVDRVILGALLGSTEGRPFRVGDIQGNLRLGPNAPRIRPDVIEDSLRRLLAERKVCHAKKKHAYYLTDETSREVAQVARFAEDLFQPVVNRMLEDTAHLFTFEVGSSVCQGFICECFARFGARLARAVSGESREADVVDSGWIRGAFLAATEGRDLSEEATESLRVRCLDFLTSPEQEDKQLRFYLTQGFYFLELLGLEAKHFLPVSKEVFSGSVLYLDTNVFVLGVVPTDGPTSLFRELGKIARQLNIELRVTRATINEARRLAADRGGQIAKIIDALPEELLHRSSDQFVTGFLEARKSQPALTPEQFLAPFDRLYEIAEKDLGLLVVEKEEQEVIGARDSRAVVTAIQSESLKTRRMEKRRAPLAHDLCHYLLVIGERPQNPKTWFLTRDQSLIRAGAKIAGRSGQSFCFGLMGFLQSISPFVTSGEDTFSLAEVFSNLVTEQLLPREGLFEARELVLFAEMHEDVLRTPEDRLVRAVDYVKSTVLRGRPYRPEDTPRVALGLRTFLASSADERQREMVAQLENVTDALRTERGEREAETRLRGELTETLQREREEKREFAQKSEGLEQQLNVLLGRERARTQRVWLFATVLGFALGLCIWLFGEGIQTIVYRGWWSTRIAAGHLRALLGAVGAAAFWLPAAVYLRTTRFPRKLREGVLAFVIGGGLIFSRLFDPPTWATWSVYLYLCTLIAGLIVFVRRDPPH